MSSCPTTPLLRRLVLRVAWLGLLLPAVAPAQVIWDGGGGNNRWGTGNNWNPNGVPDGADDVQFNAFPSPPATIQLRGNRSADSLIYNNVNDDFALVNGTGSRTLTLTSGDITRTAGSSGTQSLDFTTLALGGDAAMNIGGSDTFTINANIVDSGGARSLTKSGGGELILAGNNTFSGNTTLSAGTLTLADDTALGSGSTLTISGGTLKLSTATTSITNLTVTGNSTIDFGGAVADLFVTNLTLSAGITLSIINWVNASDHFYATNWLDGGNGAGVFDSTGAAPMNQVTFSGFAAGNTKWQSYDNQITPVPEPSAYGALLLALAGGLVYWRRRLAELVGHGAQPQVVEIKAEVRQR